MTRLNDQQRKALEVRGTSVVLGAGAGSGKTTVLTERFVRALDGDGRVGLARLAALTFTDKAAAELRGRVRQACRAKLDRGDEPEYWRGVLRGLEAAPIGTFHTFCGAILRTFAVRAGIDPGFTILTPSVAATCREEAVDACLRRALTDRDPGLIELGVTMGVDAVRERLIALIGDRSAADLDTWAASSPEDLIANWMQVFQDRVRPAVIRRFLDASRPCLDLLESHGLDHHPKMAERRERLLALVPSLAASPDPLAVLAEIREHARIVGGGKKEKWPDPELYDRVASLFKEVREDHVDSASKGLKHDDASTRIAAEAGIQIASLGAMARREYAAVKHRFGALDFDDLLVMTRDLIRDDPAVRGELTGRFDLILVDEFQDTDPVQDEIVRRIAGDTLQDGRLFLVGDFKQSIYGFRGARPDLFTRYRAEFPEEGRLPLTQNFRSRPGIIAFVNALFADAFEGEDPLTSGRDDLGPEALPAVVFAWPEPVVDDGGRDDRKVDERRRVEAARIAGLIRLWIAEGRPVVDRETREARPMRAGDVAILFRSNDAFEPFEGALAEAGLDFHLIGGPGFFSRQEVIDLINVLGAIDDPHDPISLAGALRSPFFAVSDEALFWLATVRPGDLGAGLARADEETLPDLTPDDRRLVARAHRLLERWRSFKDCEPIAAIVDRVLDESGFEASLIGEPLGDRKRANARKLVAMAREFDQEAGFALADFVARLRGDLKSPTREEQASTTDESADAVRLLTVHKSKGLEFPVVFLPDLDRKPGRRTTSVVLDPDLGPIVNTKSDEEDAEGSLGWLLHREIRGREEEDEAIRVFYVAATRARDVLVLSTSGEPGRSTESAAIRLLLDRFSPTSGACMAPLPEGWASPVASVVVGFPARPSVGRRERRKPIPLRALARLIEATLDAEDSAASTDREMALAAPRSILLEPDAGLAPHQARLARFVRAIFLDPRSLRPGGLADAAETVARLQNPIATPRMIGEAVARLSHWLEGPLGRELRNAKETRVDLPWSIRREDGLILAGRADLAYCDADGRWRLVQIADQSAPIEPDRLRLLLSAHLAPALGLGPIEQAWQIRHGENGGLTGSDRFDDGAIAACLAEMLQGWATVSGAAPGDLPSLASLSGR